MDVNDLPDPIDVTKIGDVARTYAANNQPLCPRCGRMLNYSDDYASESRTYFCDVCPHALVPHAVITKEMMVRMPRDALMGMLGGLMQRQMVDVKDIKRPKPKGYRAEDWEPEDGTYPPDWEPEMVEDDSPLIRPRSNYRGMTTQQLQDAVRHLEIEQAKRRPPEMFVSEEIAKAFQKQLLHEAKYRQLSMRLPRWPKLGKEK